VWRNGRRLLIAPQWSAIRAAVAAGAAERDSLKRELAEVTRHRDSILAALHELRADVRTLRSQAEQRVAELYRLRDIERARAAGRDPALPLN